MKPAHVFIFAVASVGLLCFGFSIGSPSPNNELSRLREQNACLQSNFYVADEMFKRGLTNAEAEWEAKTSNAYVLGFCDGISFTVAHVNAGRTGFTKAEMDGDMRFRWTNEFPELPPLMLP